MDILFEMSAQQKRDIIHEGYLYKKGKLNKSWKKRWFVLYADSM